ncbi:hypothetical protein ACFX13_025431 [Malus domestica]
MSGPSDRRFDLNFREEAAPPSPDNIWHPSFISLTGPVTVGDSVMKNAMTAAVLARNIVTPKDTRPLSRRSDDLAVKDSLALSVQCAGFVSNLAQRLFARTRQVESLVAEVISLKQEIKGLKQENKQLHRLAHDYATNMKRKIDQMQDSDSQIALDHQRFVGLYRVVKLQMIKIHYLLLLWLRRLLRLRPTSLCEGLFLYYVVFLYFPVSCSFP